MENKKSHINCVYCHIKQENTAETFCSRLSVASAVLFKQALVHYFVCTCFAVLSRASATLLISHQKPTDWTVDRGSESSTTFPKSLFGCGCFTEQGADGHLKSHPGCLDGVVTSTELELALLWQKDQLCSVYACVLFLGIIIVSPCCKLFFLKEFPVYHNYFFIAG